MKIPDKVKIGGITYTIDFSTKPDPSDVEVDGNIRYSAQKITIRSGLDEGDEYKEFVLVHEVLHGIFNMMSIEQKEEIVEKISRGLYAVIKDNPEMFSDR